MSQHPNGDEFDVNEIIAEEIIHGITHYLVRWKGFDDSENTWEPSESFTTKRPITKWKSVRRSGKAMTEAQIDEIQMLMDKKQNQRTQTSDIDLDHKVTLKRASSTNETRSKRKTLDHENPDLSTQSVKTTSKKRKKPGDFTQIDTPPNSTKTTSSTSKSSSRKTTTSTDSSDVSDSVSKATSTSTGSSQRRRSGRLQSSVREQDSQEETGSRSRSQRTSSKSNQSLRDNSLPCLYDLSDQDPLFPEEQQTESPSEDDAQISLAYITCHDSLAKSSNKINMIGEIDLTSDPVDDASISKVTLKSHTGVRKHLLSPDRFLIDLTFEERNIGIVNVLNLPSFQSKHIADLEQGDSLFITFPEVITRSQYNKRVKEDETVFSYYATGVVEPLAFNSEALEQLAVYLETEHVAGLYHHPSQDCTILLYSRDDCTWNDIGEHLGEEFDSRVQVVLRQKMGQYQLENDESTESEDDHDSFISRDYSCKRASLSELRKRKPNQKLIQDVHNEFTEEPIPPTLTPDFSISQSRLTIAKRQLFGRKLESEAEDDGNSAHSNQNPWLPAYDHSDITSTNISSTLVTSNLKVVYYLSFAIKLPRQSGIIKSWLRKDKMGIEAIFDDTEPDGWRCFTSYVGEWTCVAFFDKDSPCYQQPKLSKLLGWSNFTCWTMDTAEPAQAGQFHLTKLFPGSDGVIFIAEDAFFETPESCVFILKWIRHVTDAFIMELKLCLSRSIKERLLKLTSLKKDRTERDLLLDTIVLIDSLSTHISTGPETDVCVVFLEPDLDANQNDTVSTAGGSNLDPMLSNFASWALDNVHRYRRFVAFTTLPKPADNEHIVFRRPKDFMVQEGNFFEPESLTRESSVLVKRSSHSKSTR